ncbi:MerR family transcriptional regulator [Nonomuraea sp. NPDC050536]|uniref:MerR family transcriptional regulator n=1 Tax=Nonomuraea sp. NPDC050536 TaxID=3364366 RepID=UPI0037C7AB5C
MAELSEETGIPIPTIKYYMREGLVAPGRPTGRNQADYDDGHVRRLKLVRALAEYGDLSIAVIRELVGHLDNPEMSLYHLMGEAQSTVTQRRDVRPGPHVTEAERAVAEMVARRGWKGAVPSSAYRTVVGLLATLDEIGRQDMIDALDGYAEAAERIAETDMRVLGDPSDRERAVEIVVIGTAVGDTLIAALRRMAQASVAAPLYAEDRAP